MHHHHHSIQLCAAWEPPVPTGDGRAEWTRRFGRPAGLARGDRVLLVVGRPGSVAAICLNDAALSPPSPGAERWEADVTPLLRERNVLRVVVDAAVAGGLAATVSSGRGPLPDAVGIVTVEIIASDRGGSGTADGHGEPRAGV